MAFEPADAGGATATVRIATASFPYLTDHGFQNLVVLPGSFYIEAVLCIHAEHFGTMPSRLTHIEFLNPVILSDAETLLTASIERTTEHSFRYTFREGGDASSPTPPPCARLEVITGWPTPSGQCPAPSPTEKSEYHTDQTGYYEQLAKNGNQYGPEFQIVQKVWRNGPEALGQLAMPIAKPGQIHQLHPILLDGVAQLLASFSIAGGSTFILRGMEKLEIFDLAFSGSVWVRARLRQSGKAVGELHSGDLEVFDDHGRCHLKLSGVHFTYLGQTRSEQPAEPSKTDLVVAATFTADPVEEVLTFWGFRLGRPLKTTFAPYNQVFQELLSPESALRRNQNGFNVILLNLNDWASGSESAASKLDPVTTTNAFAGLNRHTLANGLEVAHLNRHETEYVYKEIFEDRVYLRHGIQIPEDATVVDIGANIGLFSLFVRSRAPQARVFAYEPSPVAFKALQANCSAYGERLQPFNLGVSEKRGSASLTFYEKSSVFSSFHSNADEDRQAIQAVVANMVRTELGSSEPSTDVYVDELMTGRLDRQVFDCPLLSVSDIIRDNKLSRIDLLKIDAEKCELEILRGIEKTHWPLIGQIVIEVHDRTQKAVDEVRSILISQGFNCAVEEENLLTGSGLFNVYATRASRNETCATEAEPFAASKAEVKKTADQFIQALDAYTRSSSTPTILCFCPTNPLASGFSDSGQFLREIETELIDRVRGFSNIHTLSSTAIAERYPVTDLHDPHADAAGHVPYTAEGFASIGTALVRTISALQRSPYKVIVLDCDNTLWQGACGEEGALGVKVTVAHRALQEFMLRQMEAGMLLCLCSKNSEADVWSVFDRNPDMKLRREHLVATRINWSPKSENLRSLAQELGLGLDSFIFVDDNPVECAEVQASVPAVLTLPLPANPAEIPAFLDHTWAFDHLRTTSEDLTRTHRMRENAEREKYRDQVSTLKDFIEGLHLEISIFKPMAEHFDRVSQLTLRTNQFNFTTKRRSAADIERFSENPANGCLAVNVQDRFGDYGMVGLALFSIAGNVCSVDTFLLSCRVLGRGVEHGILARVGAEARARGCEFVELPFQTTEKNQPARDFVESLRAASAQEKSGSTIYRFSAEELISLRYKPSGSSETTESQSIANRPVSAKATHTRGFGAEARLVEIATTLDSVAKIRSAMETARLHASGFAEPAIGTDAAASLEDKLLSIWRRAIGNPHLKPTDNFFEAGGTSLKAVQVVAAIRRELKHQVSIVGLFESPTVRLLAEKLEPSKTEASAASDAMERGARRKQRLRKRD
ncbi:MAG: FkbM family methyltransferase [Nibricoccus sp.]